MCRNQLAVFPRIEECLHFALDRSGQPNAQEPLVIPNIGLPAAGGES
jgi:hypothetical protein